MTFNAQKVSSLISSIKDLLEGEFRDVCVEGEVSNLSYSSSGHWYFTLSDEEASLSLALFKGDALRNPQIKTIKDGDKIICLGNISVYAKKGSFQLIAKRIMVSGKGDLKEQFELLKKKLMVEGLFDLEKKKPLPLYPKRIAVITAMGGAALQDFLNVLFRRTLSIEVVVISALVQGDEAPKSILNAFEKVLKVGTFDVVVFTRGGGSIEDLWAFNDEKLVRRMSQSPIPVVSAVGHQVDFTLSDFVADFRAETPTAAAEILSEYYVRIEEKLKNLKRHLVHSTERRMAELNTNLDARRPKLILEKIWSPYNDYLKRLSRLDLSDRYFEILRLHEKSYLIDDNLKRMTDVLEKRVADYSGQIESRHEVLKVINPQNVLGRGFAFVTTKKGGKVISSKKQIIDQDSSVSLHFHDGEVDVKVVS